MSYYIRFVLRATITKTMVAKRVLPHSTSSGLTLFIRPFCMMTFLENAKAVAKMSKPPIIELIGLLPVQIRYTPITKTVINPTIFWSVFSFRKITDRRIVNTNDVFTKKPSLMDADSFNNRYRRDSQSLSMILLK